MDIEVTPRAFFSVQLNEIVNKSLSIVDYLGDNTVASVSMTIYDSDGTDITSDYGEGTSESSGVITFGIKGYAASTNNVARFTITCVQTTPDGTALKFFVEIGFDVISSATTATSSTAEVLETFALSTLNDTKIALGIALDNTDNDKLLIHLINNATYVIETYCGRRFKATDYTNKMYDGIGTRLLTLDDYPINNISRLAIGKTNAIKVKNTTAYTVASVSVTSTAIVLRRDGSTDSTLNFSDYATMTLMVTAINAVGSGWSAELLSDTYTSYKSNELLLQYGLNAIDSNWINLEIIHDALDTYDVYYDEGQIYLPSGFPKGHNNIIITYNAGYSTIPYDIRQVCNMVVKEYYNLQKNTDGHSSEHIGSYSYKFDHLSEAIKKEINSILDMYRRRVLL